VFGRRLIVLQHRTLLGANSRRRIENSSDTNTLLIVIVVLLCVLGAAVTIIMAVFCCCKRNASEVTQPVVMAKLPMVIHPDSDKTYSAFMSHFKRECAMEARFLKDALAQRLTKKVFLDSDDLKDLRALIDAVEDSDVLVLLLSEGVLSRPWCLLELNAAIHAGVPIVAVRVEGKKYKFEDAVEYLKFLDQTLDSKNPGACQLLRDNGADPVDIAWKLSQIVPFIIAIDFDPFASGNMMNGFLSDLVETLAESTSHTTQQTKEEWLVSRDEINLDNIVTGIPVTGFDLAPPSPTSSRLPPMSIKMHRTKLRSPSSSYAYGSHQTEF